MPMNDESDHPSQNVTSPSAHSTARAPAFQALVRLLVCAALLAVTVVAGSCDSEPLGNAGTCTYQGTTFAKGASVPAGDGCNSCSCGANGHVTCTLIECFDAGTDGAPRDVLGDFTCTAQGCVGFCTYRGTLFPAGATFPATDGCNNCTCLEDGQIACTEKACIDAGQPESCTYAGKAYPVGATFPATDGCNTCSCSTAGVACTKVACLDGGVADGGALAVCTPGQDQTCNENPAISSLRGKCQPDGTCVCTSGAPSPSTGRCPDVVIGCEIRPGTLLPSGFSFTCADGCNTCTCSGTSITTTDTHCPDGGVNACNLDEAQYEYGLVGGRVTYRDHGWLFPSSITGGDYSLARTYVARGSDATTVTATCPVGLPKCGDPAAIDIGDVIADLSDLTVQKVLVSTDPSPLLLGVDTRPVDSPVFSIKRGAREVLIGAPCNGASGCAEIPPAFAKLEKDLLALDQQQLASPRCAAIKTGAFACGSTKCQTGFEYCARAMVNGVEKVAACHPYRASCTTCDCVAQDAVADLGTVSSCATQASYGCYDDFGNKVLGTYSRGALSIICAP
jgi:hypothetical protein